ncbi:undecaprenyl phosphate translocase family protein [Acholeplasma granularum]|uniref:undecaprenyl phosphate translocase family protein n=1 Tax=Acholeplasma granularum TaxID=264635 RepID=UPI0004B056A2|nr:DUF368 domain-containing protein [Acholeplasma granularum]
MIKKILQGFLVGVGAILPGVSGGMIAAAFNIYSKLIESLDQITKKPIKAVLNIWEYLVGILLGILIGFLGIAYIFYLIPIPLTLLFIGLILGGIPEIYNLSKPTSKKIMPYIIIFVTMILMLSLTIFGSNITQKDTLNTNYILWFVVGILLAVSLIVPGLSGTMLMLMIGYYGPLILVGKNLIESVLTINFDLFYGNVLQVLFVAFGVVFAFIVLGKVFNYVLKRFPKTFYQIVLGIVTIAPINIIFSLNDDLKTHENPVYIFNIQENWYMWLIGIAFIPLGIYVARLFIKEESNETEKSKRSNT